MLRLLSISKANPLTTSYRQYNTTHLFFLNGIQREKPALYFDNGKSFGYQELEQQSNLIESKLKDIKYDISQSVDHIKSSDRSKTHNVADVYGVQPRVALLCESNHLYVSSLYDIWKSGCIAVPMCKSHPKEELEYVIKDSGASALITSSEYEALGEQLTNATQGMVKLINAEERVDNNHKNSKRDYHQISYDDWEWLGGLLMYTSGTTGRPKGVLTTHGNIRAQLSMLVSSWKWAESDIILHCLPLHHLHGVLNALLCPLAVGASVVMMKKFNPQQVWSKLLGESYSDSNTAHPQVSLFMGVPTMYSKLIQYYNDTNTLQDTNRWIKDHCVNNIRLMVSGSSSLSEPMSDKWTSITGHVLLERYGMTEIGMCLSNPYDGVRMPGHVGSPLPTVEVQIQPQNDSDKTDSNNNEEKSGTLLVKGPAVFKGYWGRPQQTKETFTDDGWFITGDTVVQKNNVFRVLGRTSVDIIKSSGYKISALEIERVLLEHPNVKDCAVFGIKDEILGEKIIAIIALDPVISEKDCDFSNIIESWCLKKLAGYKVPRRFITVDELPRNVMGKINKKLLQTSHVSQL